MKKLLLLCALPLSLALFSFMSKTNDTGVTDDQNGYYDISANNSISASDANAITKQIEDIYGMNNVDPNLNYQLNVNTTTTGTWAITTTIVRGVLQTTVVYGDIPYIPSNNLRELQNISATCATYVNN
jgi:hypothetical protein